MRWRFGDRHVARATDAAFLAVLDALRRQIPDGIKVSLLSLIVFAAWVLAAEGWARAVALVWLVYPAVAARRAVRRRRRS